MPRGARGLDRDVGRVRFRGDLMEPTASLMVGLSLVTGRTSGLLPGNSLTFGGAARDEVSLNFAGLSVNVKVGREGSSLGKLKLISDTLDTLQQSDEMADVHLNGTARARNRGSVHLIVLKDPYGVGQST